jgi:hypothetical protein
MREPISLNQASLLEITLKRRVAGGHLVEYWPARFDVAAAYQIMEALA